MITERRTMIYDRLAGRTVIAMLASAPNTLQTTAQHPYGVVPNIAVEGGFANGC